MHDDLNNSSYWKFGIFYFNPDNRKVFVPKRIGIGWTLNFARWQTTLIIGALIILLAISLLTTFK